MGIDYATWIRTRVLDRAGEHPEWRFGQAIFNRLAEDRPDLADRLQSTELDPFHRDDACLPTRSWLAEHWDDEDRAAACTCHPLAVGMHRTDSCDWDPACPQHGTASTWWNSPQQVAERAERRRQLVALQRRAAELRRTR